VKIGTPVTPALGSGYADFIFLTETRTTGEKDGGINRIIDEICKPFGRFLQDVSTACYADACLSCGRGICVFIRCCPAASWLKKVGEARNFNFPTEDIMGAHDLCP